MRRILPILMGSLACSLHAQSIDLHGLVTNKAGKPVPNAVVLLAGKGLKDTSGTDGSYAIVRKDPSAITPSIRSSSQVSLDGGDLVVTLDEPTSLGVELFDVAGTLLHADLRPRAGAGTSRFSLSAARAQAVATLVRVTVGGRSTTFRCPALGIGDLVQVGASAPRTAATLDTLVATALGYATSKVPVSGYEQAVNLVLDTASTAVKSTGCDKTRTLANGTISIQSGGKTRKYILKVPDAYDKSQPYRLVFAFAESGSSAQSVANRNYFRMAGYDSKSTIFVAPDAENGAGSWSKSDVDLTDAILAQVQSDLCIDKSRVFATGFSFGGAMSLALACTRADVFRGVAFFSGADLTGSCPTTLTKPIAYYASQASGDASGTPMPTSGRIKQAQFAKVNGCTEEPNSTVFPAAGKAHTCTVYKNCKAGYPTVYCVFDGPHGWEPVDPGQSTSWDPPEAWKFITQF